MLAAVRVRRLFGSGIWSASVSPPSTSPAIASVASASAMPAVDAPGARASPSCRSRRAELRLVLCLEVLEHLGDPAVAVKRARSRPARHVSCRSRSSLSSGRQPPSRQVRGARSATIPSTSTISTARASRHTPAQSRPSMSRGSLRVPVADRPGQSATLITAAPVQGKPGLSRGRRTATPRVSGAGSVGIKTPTRPAVPPTEAEAGGGAKRSRCHRRRLGAERANYTAPPRDSKGPSPAGDADAPAPPAGASRVRAGRA